MIPRAVIPDVSVSAQTPGDVEREFRVRTADGARVQCAGTARRNPGRLLTLGYVPRYKIELFNATFYLSDVRKNEDVRFVIAYVALDTGARRAPPLAARLFYKDGSLLWRSASHFAKSATENWIGKGDLKVVTESDGASYYYSAEHTTDLPLEMQAAVESLTQHTRRAPTDRRAVPLVLRRSSETRLIAYRDFTDPRRRAARDARNLVHGGRAIARFTKQNVPESLVFARGYAPDFSAAGVVGRSTSHSKLYGGTVTRLRILSHNRHVQYLFLSTPERVWIGHPQALTTELSSYGVRTIDVNVPDDLVVPGMEYHYLESDDPPVWLSQIPPGFAGAINANDPWRADASAWLDRLPVVQEFRRSGLVR